MYISVNQCQVICGGLPFKGVIHIGAHHGEEAKDYEANGVKKVFWFEANPEAYDELVKKTANLNNIDQTYILSCLSDKDNEEVNFHIANNGHSSSILDLGTHAKMYPHIKYTKSISMKTKRFDSMVDEKTGQIGTWPDKLTEFDFINLDVQGAELKVLKGFGDLFKKYSNIRAVYTEVNFEYVYKGCCLVQELDEYLGQFGFKRVATAAPERTWGDALYHRL